MEPKAPRLRPIDMAHRLFSPRTRVLAAAGVLGLAVAAGVTSTRLQGTTIIDSGPAPLRVTPIAFRSFDDCGGLLRYFRSNGGKLVTPYGLPGDVGFGRDIAVATESSAGTAAGGAPVSAAAPATRAADTTSASGTNVQVAGVDEADLVKRSGDLLLTVADGRLRLARLDSGRVRMLGSLTFTDWQPSQLLLDGDTALLIGQTSGPVRPEDTLGGAGSTSRVVPDVLPYRPFQQITRIAQVDLADPAAPRLVRTLDVAGSPNGVRMVDGIARIVLTSQPDLTLEQPQISQFEGSTSRPSINPETAFRRASDKALARNRVAVARSTIDAWLPRFTLTEQGPDGAAGETSRGRLLDCSAISAPEEFSGLSTVSLLNLDLRTATGISSWAGAGVVATGSTLYATADHAYLSTSPWVDWNTLKPEAARLALRRQHTQIHLFDTADSTAPKYVGSGQVTGFLLGQFAMDEYQGRLRVASTEQPEFAIPLLGGPAVDVPAAPGSAADTTVAPALAPEQPRTSQSMVSVLERRGGRLTTVGLVDGLGRGEQIRAVRFLGPLGYVVTFRQTDPLYTVDLSAPTRPRVAGELKILGYSAYLHPLGDGKLLGLGQDADKNGQTSGLQLSLFDVSDPADPRRIDQLTVRGAWSDVEGDHHAFSFTGGMALAPFTGYSEVTTGSDPAAKATAGSTDPSVGAGDSGGASVEGSGGLPQQVFDAGVLAVRVDGDRFGAQARLRPLADGPVVFGPEPGPAVNDAMSAIPLRTQVLDGYVYTVTPIGIAAHDATTMKRVGFTRF